MSNLKNKASKNFEEYLNNFLSGTANRLLPKNRLSDAEWAQLNYELAKNSIEMIPRIQNGAEYMAFNRISASEKNKRLLLAGKLATMENLANRFEYISGVHGWEYKDRSGLGFEHIRLNIDNMSASEINKIRQACQERSITLQEMNTNKGRFLFFNIADARNVAPDNYIPNNRIKYSIYNDASVSIIESDKIKIQQILDIDDPVTEYDNMSEISQNHTEMIIKKYDELGLVNLNQMQKLAQDIRQNLMAEFASNDKIANQIICWDSLKESEKKQLVKDVNYIIGSQRMVHTGKTIVISGSEEENANGHFRPGTNEEKEFMYNDRLLKTTFDRCFSTLVHENIHRFQNNGLSAVSLPLVRYMNQIYVNKPYKHYFNNLIECESRYIQAYVMRNFSRDFIRYYNQKVSNNIITNASKNRI